MPKDERKRQRRLARQGTESVSEGPADVSAVPLDQTPVSPLDADATREDIAPETGDSEPGPTKPIALAQILANPSYSENLRANAAQTGTPISESTIEHIEPQPDLSNAPPAPEGNDVSPEPPILQYGRPIPATDDPLDVANVRARPTREPVIIALLLVALIMLAVDTYFTLRLNGLSDRLSELAAKSAAPVVTAADRPWVGVDTVETAQFANGGQPVTTVHIVNSGRQPAYDLRSNTVGSLRAVAAAPPEIPAQKGPLATTGLLMPNTGGKLTFFANTRALTAEEAANVKKGQYVLWLAGRLDYKDAAGRAHLTTFRYHYDPTLNSFIAAPQGNSAN
ncbi:MAG TPA: hypothetical protein VHW69_02010 [Rhizomicrobium sp.]|nr:hypothetical protein [Rhizomicrobium sp.]